MVNLWLFDIDGTLINVNGLHLIAYKEAYKNVLCLDVPDEIILNTFGMPQKESQQIILSKMDNNSIDKIDNVLEQYQNIFLKLTKDQGINPLPGVINILEQLSNSGDVVGVVSGNMENRAKMILLNSGLLNYFEVLSFDNGGDGGRELIVKKAIDQAQKNNPIKKIIVFGDTPMDIIAGKKNGCFTVGLLTGNNNLDELQKENPSLLLESLENYQEVINLVKSKLKE